jgi:uncharacterized membrane protein required for colicin V production
MALEMYRDVRELHILRMRAVRSGVYIGVLLAVVLSSWIYVANRVPSLERVALERNLVAASLLFVLALFPVLRFFRQPRNLLISALIAWTLLSFTYRVLCLFFGGLEDWHSPLQIFTAGVVLYLIVATLSWIGICIWRSFATHTPHSNHHS